MFFAKSNEQIPVSCGGLAHVVQVIAAFTEHMRAHRVVLCLTPMMDSSVEIPIQNSNLGFGKGSICGIYIFVKSVLHILMQIPLRRVC